MPSGNSCPLTRLMLLHRHGSQCGNHSNSVSCMWREMKVLLLWISVYGGRRKSVFSLFFSSSSSSFIYYYYFVCFFVCFNFFFYFLHTARDEILAAVVACILREMKVLLLWLPAHGY